MLKASFSFGKQDISSRHLIMMGAIGLLVILNIWRWWPASGMSNGHTEANQSNSVAEKEINFLNYIPPSKKEVSVTRNLFIPFVKKAAYKKPVEIKKKIDKPSITSNKKPSELRAFKLEGILDTDGRVQAFLSRQDDVYMVYKGERLSKTIMVEKITHDGILLKDELNGSTLWVSLGGD